MAATVVDCGICLGAVAADAVRIQPCGHIQHKACQLDWESEDHRAMDCPTCRTPVQAKEDCAERVNDDHTEGDAEDREKECPVCMEVLAGGTACVEPCKHEFHSDCIGKWRDQSDTCPMCRSEIISVSEHVKKHAGKHTNEYANEYANDNNNQPDAESLGSYLFRTTDFSFDVPDDGTAPLHEVLLAHRLQNSQRVRRHRAIGLINTIRRVLQNSA